MIQAYTVRSQSAEPYDWKRGWWQAASIYFRARIWTCLNIFPVPQSFSNEKHERKSFWGCRSWMSALVGRVKASILIYSHWNTGTELKTFENSSITSIRFKHKNLLLVSSPYTPIGDRNRGVYGDIKSNRSDLGNLKFIWFVAVSFGHGLWSLIKSDMFS